MIIIGFWFFALVWIYALFSTLLSEFRDGTNKIVWIILLIFLPISAILYPFIGKRQTTEPESRFQGFYTYVFIWIGIFSAIVVGDYIRVKVENYFGITLVESLGTLGYILEVVITMILSAVIAYGTVFIFAILTTFFSRKGAH